MCKRAVMACGDRRQTGRYFVDAVERQGSVLRVQKEVSAAIVVNRDQSEYTHPAQPADRGVLQRSARQPASGYQGGQKDMPNGTARATTTRFFFRSSSRHSRSVSRNEGSRVGPSAPGDGMAANRKARRQSKASSSSWHSWAGKKPRAGRADGLRLPERSAQRKSTQTIADFHQYLCCQIGRDRACAACVCWSPAQRNHTCQRRCRQRRSTRTRGRRSPRRCSTANRRPTLNQPHRLP